MGRYIDLSGDSRFDPYAVNPCNRGRPRKYGNKKTVVNGITFDSLHEANRYRELTLLWRSHEIHNLKRQVKYELVPAIRQNGKVIQRAISYYADFVYIDSKTGHTVVEDAKGYKTDVYKMKKKMMLDKYGIEIREV